MIAHNQAYFKDEDDDLYEDSLAPLVKNETIEHTREPSKKEIRESLYQPNSIEGLNLNVNSTTSSVEPKKWVGNEMSRRESEIKIEQS